MEQKHWTEAPSRKQVLLFGTTGLVSFLFILLAITDFFTGQPFQAKNIMVFVLMLPAAFAIYKIIRNYYKNNLRP